MKKTILIVLLSALLLAGCGSGTDGGSVTSGDNTAPGTTAEHTHTHEEPVSKGNLVEENGVFRVTEENFVNGVYEVYGYRDDYIGKKIQFEGEYMADMLNGEMYYQVYRIIHEECNQDHDHSTDYGTRVGFRIQYDGDKPMDKSFVRVVGTVDTYESDGSTYIIIKADTLEVCETAGIVELS